MRRAIAILATAALAGCSLAPTYVRPTAPVAPGWPVGDAYLAQSEAALPSLGYADVFTDPRLGALIAQSLDNNRDIRVAYANLAAARAQVRVIRSAQFPEIVADGGVTYRRNGGGSNSNGGNNGNGNGNTGTGSGGRSSTDFSLQGGVNAFELDLFGRLANATESDRNLALASEATARAIRLGVIADLATAWLTYAADRELLGIAQQTVASAQRSYDLTDLRLKGGIAPRTELRQAEQVLATAQGDVATQTAAVAQDENLIRLLLGTPTVDPALLPADLADVADTVRTLPAGTASEILLRRPDVLDAEYRLRAANADIGVARAALFPSISLTGLLGLASDALGSLFTGDAFNATAGAGVSASIFDFGGRRANVRVTQAQRDAALATYEGAIQTAFREVADALADQGTLGARLAAARRNSAAAADTAQLVELRYRSGIDSSLAQLDAQRSLYTARRDETATGLAALLNRVELYRALGGDTAAASTANGPSRPLPSSAPFGTSASRVRNGAGTQ